MYAPIVLFVYNRPDHTKRTLESLEKNFLSKESELYIYSDGPKKGVSKEQIEKIFETRKMAKERRWCGGVHIIERKENMGLANSVIAGVTEIINKFGRIIVLEDDLLLSKYFLKYMNDALNRYENEDCVMQISGYMFPVEIYTKYDALFLPFTNSWGWATWRRSWNLLDRDSKGLDILRKSPIMRKRFDLDNSYPFFKMLLNQKAGRVDSWGIRFYLSVFLNNGLVLYPKKSLVINNGFDRSGTHGIFGILQAKIDDNFKIKKYDKIEINEKIQKTVYLYLKKQNNLVTKLINAFKNKLCIK